MPVDEALYDPIVQVLGVVADSDRQDDARAFARFLLGEVGQGILREDGFRPPSEPSTEPEGSGNGVEPAGTG